MREIDRDWATQEQVKGARADLCRRSGRISEARVSHEKALALARQEPEPRLLAWRLAEIK
jgi:RNA polymerase sigma-70 factor, ECF subfamily